MWTTENSTRQNGHKAWGTHAQAFPGDFIHDGLFQLGVARRRQARAIRDFYRTTEDGVR